MEPKDNAINSVNTETASTEQRKPMGNRTPRRGRRFNRNRLKRVISTGGLINRINRSVGQPFQLIDKNYKIRTEIMPGLIAYSSAITGTIKVNLSIDLLRMFKVMKLVVDKWSETVTYVQLRSLRSTLGIPTSKSERETLVELTTIYVTNLAKVMQYGLTVDNLQRDLEERGFVSLNLPQLALELLQLGASLKKIHYVNNDASSMIRFEIESIKFTGDGIKYELIEKMDIIDSIQILTKLAINSEFGQNRPVNNLSELCVTSPYLFNAYIGNKKDPESLDLMISQGTTEKDIVLATLIGINNISTDLPKSSLYTMTYKVSKKRLNGALKRFILSHYHNISEQYVSPSINSVSDEVFETEIEEKQITD